MSSDGDLAGMRAVAAAWEAACRSGDPDRIVAQLGEDAIVWYNYEKIEHDRAAYRAILATSARRFRNVRYIDFRVHLHAGGFVEQATLEGDTDAGPLSTPFLLSATVKDGKLVRLEQYFDATTLQPLRDAAA
jgi:hypothetical protein